MASKRKLIENEDDISNVYINNKKHTLDSDEDDSDAYEKDDMHDSDVEGEEEGVSGIQDDIKMTPFNMREELREGHFDKDGHYHWNNDDEIKDNWLDNIDWVKVKNEKNSMKCETTVDDSLPEAFDELRVYGELLAFMQHNEKVKETLQRLGRNRQQMSSVERLKQKKLGIIDKAGEKITKFTELANDILTKTGNMDIYQMTYAEIKDKIDSKPGSSKLTNIDMFDMYADDFNEKEKQRIENDKKDKISDHIHSNIEQMWEFKWKDNDIKIEGPYDTKQMLKWSQDGHFKDGVYVRRVGESDKFYRNNRIDFELYL